MRGEQLREYVQSVSEELCHNDAAWHSLVEAGPVALPYVIEVFNQTKDRDQRLALMTVISEYRTQDALAFLSAQLSSGEPAIWKAALDGLVTLGGIQVIDVLTKTAASAERKKQEWILEALDQVRSSPGSSGVDQ